MTKLAFSVLGFFSLVELSIQAIPSITDGCFKTKGCITPVDNCIKNNNCERIITFKKNVDFFDFELMADIQSDSGYVAMGLSKDSQMGHDLVVECVKFGTTLEVYQSWNSVYTNTRIPKTICSDPLGGKGLVNCTVIVEDGKIYCRFKRYRVIAHQFKRIGRWGVATTQFYVLLVAGNDVKSDGIGKHNGTFSTKFPIDFNKFVQKPFESQTQKFTHVYTMVVCWIVFVPNAMFIARYLKETMTDSTCCDRKAWFVGHSGLMSAGFMLCMTSVGFILWGRSYNDSKWPLIPSSIRHAQIGTAATAIFLIQIVSGWYRPLTAKKTYSIVHAFLGTFAYGLGVTNMIQSYYVGMPCYVYWIVIGSLLWQTLWHIFMILHFVWLDTNLGLKKCRALSPAPIKVVIYDDAPGRKQRLRITIINLVGSICFAIGLCLIYHFQHNTCPCRIDYCRRIPHENE